MAQPAPAPTPKLAIRTVDGITCEIDQKAICKFSKTIETMVMDLDQIDTDAQGDQESPMLMKFTKRTLDLIMTWAEHHKSDDPAQAVNMDDIPREERAEHMSAWDKTFIDGLSHADLSALMIASDFLDIEELSQLLCQSLILITRSKTVDEIRQIFGLTDDLTPEQKEQIALENAWLQPPQ